MQVARKQREREAELEEKKRREREAIISGAAQQRASPAPSPEKPDSAPAPGGGGSGYVPPSRRTGGGALSLSASRACSFQRCARNLNKFRMQIFSSHSCPLKDVLASFA